MVTALYARAVGYSYEAVNLAAAVDE